jgi:hypothetical protein
MQISFITPTAYIEKFANQGHFHLVLSHLLDRSELNEYEKLLVSSGKNLVLDNGLFENHKPEGIDSLIQKALRIKAKIFFAPDYLYNAEQTLKGVEMAIYIKNKVAPNSDLKIGVVVQADNEQDWLSLYDKFVHMHDVALIGLSILSIPRCFGIFKGKETKKIKYIHDNKEITPSRIKCLKALIDRGNNYKSCHLLGLGDSLQDIIFAKELCPFVYSHDSSSAFWNALQGKKILEDGSIEGGKTEIKVDFSFKNATKEQLELAQKNINIYKRLLL